MCVYLNDEDLIVALPRNTEQFPVINLKTYLTNNAPSELENLFYECNCDDKNITLPKKAIFYNENDRQIGNGVIS